MRIIERTSPITKSVTYVVQDNAWNGAGAYQNGLGIVYPKPYQDIREFPSFEAAKAFAFQYENNLQPGERIVG